MGCAAAKQVQSTGCDQIGVKLCTEAASPLVDPVVAYGLCYALVYEYGDMMKQQCQQGAQNWPSAICSRVTCW